MTDPASLAAINRVANGDHSPDAQAQLLIVIAQCTSSTSRHVKQLEVDVSEIKEQYASCPARVEQAAHVNDEKKNPKKEWTREKTLYSIIIALISVITTLVGVMVKLHA